MELIREEITKKDEQEIKSWSNKPENTTSELKNSYQRFERFGLLDLFANAWELIELYKPIETKNAKVTNIAYRHPEDSEILGFAILEFVKDADKEQFIFVHHFMVNPKLLHKGIGSYMLKDIMSGGIQFEGFEPEEIIYCVDRFNEPCIAMLEKLGFEQQRIKGGIVRYKSELKGKENGI